MTLTERHRAIALAIGVAWGCLAFAAACEAQDRGFQSARPQGFYGVGHEQWHHIYKRIRKAGTNGNWLSCCNGEEGRPTSARLNEGVWEVMVDGVWTVVPNDKIIHSDTLALQGIDRDELGPTAHVFAGERGKAIYCVILPSTGG